ncbi:hypothetical protein BDC45DRAFT_536400 [Circinella umbellata]|nr:hypothetical protein BDC45DRAFT_536400 [Circinella umbellata]
MTYMSTCPTTIKYVGYYNFCCIIIYYDTRFVSGLLIKFSVDNNNNSSTRHFRYELRPPGEDSFKLNVPDLSFLVISIELHSFLLYSISHVINMILTIPNMNGALRPTNPQACQEKRLNLRKRKIVWFHY